MKSPYKLSQEFNVTPQAVYKKIRQLSNELNNHIKRENGKILLDDEAERILGKSFFEVQQPLQQPVDERFNNQFNSEIEFLREQNKLLQEELTKEREHSRTQADRIADLAENLAELNRNNQLLLGIEQHRTNPALIDENASSQESKKQNFLSNIFKKKNKKN